MKMKTRHPLSLGTAIKQMLDELAYWGELAESDTTPLGKIAAQIIAANIEIYCVELHNLRPDKRTERIHE